MPQALYRTYRPTSFADVVSQTPIKVTLQNEIERKHVAHAYLFSGPRGVGKTTTARLLAKAVNCRAPKKGEPCNSCELCREIMAGRSLDVIEIDAASHTGVDNVRENIIENARFTPQRNEYKVFIIDEVHMLSVSAFNALLKTLEEPPAHVIFILATTEIHRVPETIISRCQRFDFKRVAVDELVRRLVHIAKQEKVTVADDVLTTIARRADGSVRDAEVLLGQVLSIGEKKITAETASVILPRSNTALLLELFEYVVRREREAGVALIGRVVEEGIIIGEYAKEFTELLRRLLLAKVSGNDEELSGQLVDETLLKNARQLLEQVTAQRLMTMVRAFMGAQQELRYADIQQLPLELAVLELCEEPAAPAATPSVTVAMKPTTVRPPASPVPVKPPVSAATVSVSPETTPTARKPKTAGTTAVSVTIEQVMKAWPEIINKLSAKSRSLGLSLKVGTPVEIQDNQLIVGFQYKFHVERVTNRNVKRTVEEVIEAVLGEALPIATTIVATAQPAAGDPEAASGESTFNQALQVFGGSVIEE